MSDWARWARTAGGHKEGGARGARSIRSSTPGPNPSSATSCAGPGATRWSTHTHSDQRPRWTPTAMCLGKTRVPKSGERRRPASSPAGTPSILNRQPIPSDRRVRAVEYGTLPTWRSGSESANWFARIRPGNVRVVCPLIAARRSHPNRSGEDCHPERTGGCHHEAAGGRNSAYRGTSHNEKAWATPASSTASKYRSQGAITAWSPSRVRQAGKYRLHDDLYRSATGVRRSPVI